MFYVIGVGISFFLSFLLFTKEKKNPADKILAIWLLFMGLHLLLFYLRISNQLPTELMGVEMPLPLVHGPFLFLYTTALTTDPQLRRKRFSFLHFAPALASYLYLIQVFILTNEEKIAIWKSEGKGYETFTFIQFAAITSSGFIYVIASFITLIKHKRNIINQFSATEKINLDWLRYLIIGIGLIWVAVIYSDEKLLFTVVVLFVLFIGLFGIRQVGIFHPTSLHLKSAEPVVPQNTDAPSLAEKQKYEKSGLTSEIAETLKAKLADVMIREKLYVRTELTLTELADYLETQPNHLSQLLNDWEGKSFYDYINSLRIEEFKRLVSIPESQRLTIMGLASNCGFSSKSSFNRYFKKATGQPPSEYLKSIPRLSARERETFSS